VSWHCDRNRYPWLEDAEDALLQPASPCKHRSWGRKVFTPPGGGGGKKRKRKEKKKTTLDIDIKQFVFLSRPTKSADVRFTIDSADDRVRD